MQANGPVDTAYESQSFYRPGLADQDLHQTDGTHSSARGAAGEC
jgi:hypothetical protein